MRSIAYMEVVLQPSNSKEFKRRSMELTQNVDGFNFFMRLRSQAGEKIVLEDNIFIERLLPMMQKRALSEAELAAYAKPFLNHGEDRRPLLS